MDSTVTTSDGHWQAHLTNPHLAPRETLYCLGLLSGKTDKAIARDHNIEAVGLKMLTTNSRRQTAPIWWLSLFGLRLSG